MVDLDAAHAIFAEEWGRAVAAFRAVMDPANTRYEKARTAALQARATDPKAEIPAGEVAAWLAASQDASAAFHQIADPARQTIQAALNEAKESTP